MLVNIQMSDISLSKFISSQRSVSAPKIINSLLRLVLESDVIHLQTIPLKTYQTKLLALLTQLKNPNYTAVRVC